MKNWTPEKRRKWNEYMRSYKKKKAKEKNIEKAKKLLQAENYIITK